jgi:hypothetical protein
MPVARLTLLCAAHASPIKTITEPRAPESGPHSRSQACVRATPTSRKLNETAIGSRSASIVSHLAAEPSDQKRRVFRIRSLSCSNYIRNCHFTRKTDNVNSTVMADDLTGNIRIGGSVLYQELEDEVVLLNMENQEYYGLNDVGARMWKSLMETGNVAASADQLTGLYAADETVIRTDLELLVRDLTDAGLLQRC